MTRTVYNHALLITAGMFLALWTLGASPAQAQTQPIPLTIVWEADTYTPPLYAGAALPTAESALMLVAFGIPAGTGELIYTWEQDHRVLGSKSGAGKRVLSLQAPAQAGKSTTIAVTARTAGGVVVGRGETTIIAASPQIRLYEESPALGVLYNTTAASPFAIRGQERSLIAEPFFFRRAAGGGIRATEYKWQLDGQSLDSVTGPRVTLGNTGEGRTAQLSLSARQKSGVRFLTAFADLIVTTE